MLFVFESKPHLVSHRQQLVAYEVLQHIPALCYPTPLRNKTPPYLMMMY